MTKPRPRRSWLFVAGADEAAHRAASRSGADVMILELEDFLVLERPGFREWDTDDWQPVR